MSEDRSKIVAEAYRECERLARGHYENFSMASRLLPAGTRRHMFALYAFARGVDDLGDEAEGDRPALLDRWEAELHWALEEGPEPAGARPAAFVALRASHAELDLPTEPFGRLIEANRRDQRVDRYQTWADLLEYCTYSADPVGRIVLHIFGHRDPSLFPLSDATCTALQVTNFLQDVARDHAMGRIYLPREDLDRFGVTEQMIEDRDPTAEFRDLIRFQTARTRTLFGQGRVLLEHVTGRFRFDLTLFTLGGEAVLDAIEEQGWDVLTERPALRRRDRIRLMAKAAAGRGTRERP